MASKYKTVRRKIGKLKKGATKTVKGVTYKLNKNFRWEKLRAGVSKQASRTKKGAAKFSRTIVSKSRQVSAKIKKHGGHMARGIVKTGRSIKGTIAKKTGGRIARAGSRSMRKGLGAWVLGGSKKIRAKGKRQMMRGYAQRKIGKGTSRFVKTHGGKTALAVVGISAGVALTAAYKRKKRRKRS